MQQNGQMLSLGVVTIEYYHELSEYLEHTQKNNFVKIFCRIVVIQLTN